MMEGKVMKRNVFFAQALKAAGIDLTKDFFACRLRMCRKLTKYAGRFVIQVKTV